MCSRTRADRGAQNARATAGKEVDRTKVRAEQSNIRAVGAEMIALDRRFRRYIVPNASVMRLHLGTLWAEGPAWNGVGRYLVWSDIPNDIQLRWIEENDHVIVFRKPSGYSNGNTFDY